VILGIEAYNSIPVHRDEAVYERTKKRALRRIHSRGPCPPARTVAIGYRRRRRLVAPSVMDEDTLTVLP
jgi:hypothetical protein